MHLGNKTKSYSSFPVGSLLTAAALVLASATGCVLDEDYDPEDPAAEFGMEEWWDEGPLPKDVSSDEDEAVKIANDTDYGLAAYVCSNEMERARIIARRLRAGQVAINYVAGNTDTPFGGYKQSGNGREKGKWGLTEFLEVKAITGLKMDRKVR